jgi:hypothetical protein
VLVSAIILALLQLGQLSEREVRDLIAYLMTPGQTPLP